MRNIIALGLLATTSLLTGQAQAIPGDAGYDSYPYSTTYPDFTYPDFDGGLIYPYPYPYDGGIGVPEWIDAGAPPTEEPPVALDAGTSSATPNSSAAPDTSAVVTSGSPESSGPNETEEPVTEPSVDTGSTTGDGSNTSVVVETSSEPVGGGTGPIDAGSTDAVTIPAETSSPVPSATTTSDEESPTSDNEGNDTSGDPGDTTTEDDDLPTVVADAGVDAGGFVDDGGSDDGCNCRVAGAPQSNASKFGGLAFAGLAFIAMGRRRQRRA